MSCFPCFSSHRSKKSSSKNEDGSTRRVNGESKSPENKKKGEDKIINAKNFTFRELATATKNFRQECLLGEGGFGRVYKGTIQGSGQVVAIKQLDRNGLHGNKEFLSEVLELSLLNHSNLVNLIGYCADGDQRLLVHEYLPGGSLHDLLLEIGPKKKAIDWYTRIKIGFGIATGLEYLHDQAPNPVVYRDLKSSNILLDNDLNPKLSDFGLAKLGPPGELHVSSRVMGTYGYSAPEYTRSGQLTLQSDIYSFGVVFLELITGRKAIDTTRPNDEQNLVTWSQPFFRYPKRFPDLADPLLNGQFPERDLNQAVAIAAMCLQEEPTARPLISDVVTTLSFLSTTPSEVVEAHLPASENPDTEKSKNQDEEAAKNLSSSNNTDHEEGGQSSGNEESESSEYDEGQGTATEDQASEKRQYSNSSHKSSIQSLDNKNASSSSPSSPKSGSRSQGGSASSSSCSSNKSSSPDQTVSSCGSNSLTSNPSSGEFSDEVVSLGQKNRRRESLEKSKALSRSSTKGSRNGSFSLSRSSRREAQGGKSSFSRNSSATSVGSQGRSECLDHCYSFGSQDGIVSFNISRVSEDGSVHS